MFTAISFFIINLGKNVLVALKEQFWPKKIECPSLFVFVALALCYDYKANVANKYKKPVATK